MGFKSKLSPKDLEKAQAELNEDPKTRKDKIKELLTRCKSSPKVPASCYPRLDDAFLLRYLRVAKFDAKNALERIERFFQLQRDWPELYGNFKWDAKMERLLESGSTELMPEADEDGCRYLVFRLSKWDPKVDTVHEVYRACIFLWEYLLLDESVQVNGIKVCGDQGSLTWGHLSATPMRVNKLWAQAVDGCYPIRNKKTAMIRFPGWFMTVYGLYQKFMSAKMQNRVLLVGHDLDLLSVDFSANHLPVDFGGTVPNENAANITKKIKQAAPQLEKDFAYLKQLCNENGSYTMVDENDQLSEDMEKLRVEIEQRVEENLATDL